MRTLRLVYTLLVAFLGTHLCEAQKLNFEYLTVKDGLAQNAIESITKDKYGFMWFGTFNGLCRYDGYKFKTYNAVPGDTTSLANNRIYYIYKDKKGTLWVGTFDSYVCRYNYQTDNFTRYKVRSLPQWLRDSTSRLRNLANLKLNALRLQNWVGRFGLGPTKEHIVFQTSPNQQNRLNDNNVYCVYQDRDDMVWLGTSTGGINKADLRAKPFFHYPLYTRVHAAANAAIRAMETDDSGGLWLGTLDTGLVYLDKKKGIKKYFGIGPVAKTVRVIYKDSFGDLWIGYRTGLDRYNPKQNRFVNYYNGNNEPASTKNRFLSIAEDPLDHSIWFGTFEGLIRYDRRTQKFEPQSLKNYFDRASAMCLFFDKQHNLWIGTEYAGIIELKRNKNNDGWQDTLVYQANGKAPKLPDNSIFSITQDNQGNIWAGTANGLVRIVPTSGAVKVYTKQEGLADQYISKILPFKDDIWISHKKGLSRLNIKTAQVSNYDVPENLGGYQFMDCSGCIDHSRGLMNFGGTEGFISFRPGEIHNNPYVPPVVLTELQILNRTVNVGQYIDERVVLSAPLYLTKAITLTHDDRSFSIEFAALHYANPAKNQYAYMLEGADKDWIYTDASRRFAAYSNLPEGKYVFKVKAANCDGLWNNVPVRLEVIILPPLWRTWWAYLCYIACVISALYVIYKLILTRQQYHRDILLEKLKTEKAREVDELKSQFFTNISHEFRTPLSLIIDPLESLLFGKFPTDQLQHYYQIMHRNARRLLGLINQFLDLRKLEAGSLHLHVKKQDLVGFIRNIIAAFEFQAQKRGVDFSFESELKELTYSFDADVVDKVMYNLISNAFKFANSAVKVSLTIDVNDDQVILTVTDDGPGVSEEFRGKIFDPFFQIEKHDHPIGGTGVGLSLTKELITLHEGTITVSSEPGIRTCFRITLPDLSNEDIAHSLPAEQPINQGPENYDDMPLQMRAAMPFAGRTAILIVEDNEDIRNYLLASLSMHYNVSTAVNGNQGFEKAAEIIPDLIISDVMMPGLNGIGLCQMIKTDERTSHIPVILLTARQSIEYQIEGYETGADAYITKPFSTPLLLVRIQNILASRIRLRKLFDRSTGFNTRLITTNATDQAFLNKITGLIETNMADEIFDVEWLAEQMCLSRTQLYRKIKSLTDRSVHDFMTTIKLNKAAEMLLEGRYTVSEIAYLVGYSDPTNFSRNFQKQFGKTPKKYGRAVNNHLSP